MPNSPPTDPTKLALLSTLDDARPVGALAEATGYPRQRIRRVAKKLEDEGLVTTRKDGRELVVAPTSTSLPSLARALLDEYPDQDWGSILHGDRPLLLHVLDHVGRIRLTAEVMDQTPGGVHYTAKTLAPRGILTKEEGRYHIHSRHRALREFVDEIAKTHAHHRAHDLASDARVLWYLGPEVLLRSKEPDLLEEEVQVGALSALADYGVDLVTEANYYVLSDRELDASDAILQTLLVQPGDRIHRSYAALVYERELPDNLLRKAPIYGLEDEARALRRYVRNREAPEGFLTWEEHQRYREQYGVA